MKRPSPERVTSHLGPVVVLVCVLALGTVAIVAGCGGATTQGASATPSAPASPSASVAASSSPAPQGPSALTGEAASAAAGDIPDNQVFLVLHDKAAGFSMKYPEGWAQKGKAGDVTIRDKNNIVHVAIAAGATPTVASVKAQLAQLKSGSASFSAGPPATMTVSGAPAIKVTYATKSAANPVTGQRVTLVVDRYYLSRAGKVAIVDLGTPQGVDNIDAYRMMIESFRWKG